MLGVLVTLLFTIGAVGVGSFLVGRWTSELDPAESIGIHGLIGLGAIGLLTLFIGLMPDGLKWGMIVVWALALGGCTRIVPAFQKGRFKLAKPEGPSALVALAIGVAGLFALVGVLAPSDTLDWDTLAYHLAAPKVWLAAGQIQSLFYDHHSNFPFTVENLFIWGLSWGGQSGAKAFSLMFFILGLLAIFGFARRRYGASAGWWSALALATVPVILWESGTGYIDVPHGLFGGLGALYAMELILDRIGVPDAGTNQPAVTRCVEPETTAGYPLRGAGLWLAGILLGFAAGTKYTGLELLGVVGFVIFGAMALRKQVAEGLKSAVLVGVVALAVSGSWYVKNVITTGNPVYPFFYKVLGGKNWDQPREDAYKNEQQNFGAGTIVTRHSPTEIGNAILGLAYQPGRYVNPAEDKGGGTPLGAIGLTVLGAGLVWAISGAAGAFEGLVLVVVGLSFFGWFFLSQQSRYVVPFTVPLAVLAGGGIVRLKVGKLLAGVVVLQAAYSLALVYMQRFELQSQVVLGKISPEDYQSKTIAFYTPSQLIDKEVGPSGKVALYDEVFGFLLDVPYVWANPGHDTVIPYDSMPDAASYIADMKKLGFTHIYINLSPLVKDFAFAPQWVAAMGLQGPAVPLPNRQALWNDWQSKWEVLVADAAAQRLIVPVKGSNRWILFKIA